MAGRYDIKGKLARGGIGAIYLAHDNSLDREVAIKRLLPIEETKLNEPAGDSLSREASALAKFKHPNVVTIYSFEEDEEGAFVVTELIDGENLKETTERGALAIEDFENLVEQTLDPLITAKDMNLLHRDIKPSNIMVTILASGKFQIKILDFGLAKFSQTPSTQTLDQQGSFLGSIEYLAPEQLELRPLDQRTDLYSLGCVYYYTLTQASPFEGKNAAETMDNHLEHNVADIRSYRDDISDEMASWLMRLISRQPNDRPEDARQAMKEYVDAKNGIMPPGRNLKSGPVETIVATEISEPVFPIGDADPIPMETGSQAIRLNTGAHTLSSSTGPRGQTTGQRLLKQKQAELDAAKSTSSLKLPILALLGAMVLAALIFFATGGNSKDPSESEKKVTVETTSKKISPAASKDSRPAPSSDTDEVEALSKVNLPIPSKQVIQSVAPAITEGLAAHYFAGAGAYSRDGVSKTLLGERVMGWTNIAQSASTNHSLTHMSTDPDGTYSPRLVTVGPDQFPQLSGVFPALKFESNTALQIGKTNTNEELGEGGCQVLLVGNFAYEKFLSVIRLMEEGNQGGVALSIFQNSLRGIRRSEESDDVRAILDIPLNQMVVVNYSVNPDAGTQTLRITNSDGSSAEMKESISNVPLKLLSYVLGGSNKETPAEGEMTINELLIYDRSLDDDESSEAESQLMERYFGSGEQNAPDSSPAITITPGAPLATQRNLIAQYDPEVGAITAPDGTLASTGDRIFRWENVIEGEEVLPFFQVNPNYEVYPSLDLADTTPVNDPFPVIRFSPGAQLRFRPDIKTSALFPTNTVTMLGLIRMPVPELGIIARIDGIDNYGMVMFHRNPDGASLGLDSVSKGKKEWIKIPLTTNNWLFWRISFNDESNQVKVHVSYPKGGWSEMISEEVADFPATINNFQLGVFRQENTKSTSFDVAQFAIYNTFLSKDETQAVFEQWRNRYFKAD